MLCDLGTQKLIQNIPCLSYSIIVPIGMLGGEKDGSTGHPCIDCTGVDPVLPPTGLQPFPETGWQAFPKKKNLISILHHSYQRGGVNPTPRVVGDATSPSTGRGGQNYPALKD